MSKDNPIMDFLQAICDAEGINLHSYPFKHKDGVAIRDGDWRFIGYKDTLEGWPLVSLIAHELGHHLLGHLDDGKLALGKDGQNYYQNRVMREKREHEARTFAAAFTAMAVYDYYKGAVSV